MRTGTVPKVGREVLNGGVSVKLVWVIMLGGAWGINLRQIGCEPKFCGRDPRTVLKICTLYDAVTFTYCQ